VGDIWYDVLPVCPRHPGRQYNYDDYYRELVDVFAISALQALSTIGEAGEAGVAAGEAGEAGAGMSARSTLGDALKAHNEAGNAGGGQPQQSPESKVAGLVQASRAGVAGASEVPTLRSNTPL
jgi:hypothetical protein